MSAENQQDQNLMNRRPVASRQVALFQKIAAKLAASGITPNQISVASVVFALIGSLGLYNLSLTNNWGGLLIQSLIAILGIQGRLLCNLFDGLVAVEGGKKTPVGELYNDIPDRIADMILLAAVGLGLGTSGFTLGPTLGMAAGAAAILTAYVRVLGGSLSLKQSFRGPMAKQHRMAFLNVAIMMNLVEFGIKGDSGFILLAVLIVIFLGSLLTTHLRLKDIAQELRQKDAVK